MKMNLKYILIVLTLSLAGSACDSFLEVQPKGEVLADDLLKDQKGFENAMYGVYASMNTDNLYGMNLGCYALDLMAQYFDSYGNDEATPIGEFDYQNTKVEEVFYTIWSSMYTNISNVNNVLEHLEKQSTSSLKYYDIYKGEALGLRAFMHFDLLRIFSEQITLNPSAGGIPYNTTFSLVAPDVLASEKVYEHIIGDLKVSEQLLKSSEKLLADAGSENYLKDQTIHFNLQAAQAALARVYLTRGEVDSALYYARQVIEAGKQELLKEVEIDGDLAGKLSAKETIFGLYSKNFADQVIKVIHKSTSFYSLALRYNIEAIYQQNRVGNDYRWNAWFFYNNQEQKLSKLTDKYVLNNTEHLRPAGQIRGINLIRLPEMYYIAAECLLKKGDYTGALTYFNAVLKSRGLVALDERDPVETLTLERITEERYKEFVGEGQTFFNMKRLNLDIVNTEGQTVTASKKVYVVDIPDQEFDYRR